MSPALEVERGGKHTSGDGLGMGRNEMKRTRIMIDVTRRFAFAAQESPGVERAGGIFEEYELLESLCGIKLVGC